MSGTSIIAQFSMPLRTGASPWLNNEKTKILLLCLVIICLQECRQSSMAYGNNKIERTNPVFYHKVFYYYNI